MALTTKSTSGWLRLELCRGAPWTTSISEDAGGAEAGAECGGMLLVAQRNWMRGFQRTACSKASFGIVAAG